MPKFKAQPKFAKVPSLSEADMWAIRYEYLTTPSTIAHIAKKYDRSCPTISKVLSGPEYETVKASIEASMREQAKGILVRGSEQAASLWLASMPVAAARGDHKPMRDLLTATQVIDETASLPRVSIVIGVQGGDVQVSLASAVHTALAQPGSPYLVPAHCSAPQNGPELGPVQAAHVPEFVQAAPASSPADVQSPLQDCPSLPLGTSTEYTVQD